MFRSRRLIVIGALVAVVALIFTLRRRALDRNAREFIETYGTT